MNNEEEKVTIELRIPRDTYNKLEAIGKAGFMCMTENATDLFEVMADWIQKDDIELVELYCLERLLEQLNDEHEYPDWNAYRLKHDMDFDAEFKSRLSPEEIKAAEEGAARMEKRPDDIEFYKAINDRCYELSWEYY